MKSRLMQPIAITLTPSLLLLGLLVTISIVSCVILAQLLLPFDIKLALIALVIIFTVYFVLRDALLSLPSAWKRLEVDIHVKLKLTNKAGKQFEPQLSAHSLIHVF